MGVFDKFLDIMKLNEDDYDDQYDEYDEEHELEHGYVQGNDGSVACL